MHSSWQIVLPLCSVLPVDLPVMECDQKPINSLIIIYTWGNKATATTRWKPTTTTTTTRSTTAHNSTTRCQGRCRRSVQTSPTTLSISLRSTLSSRSTSTRRGLSSARSTIAGWSTSTSMREKCHSPKFRSPRTSQVRFGRRRTDPQDRRPTFEQVTMEAHFFLRAKRDIQHLHAQF